MYDCSGYSVSLMVFYSFFFFTFTGTTNILAHTLYGIKHAVTAALHIVMGKYFYILHSLPEFINNKAVCRSLS